jgi:glutamate dehydrogenase
MASPLTDDPWIATALLRYFPNALQAKYATYMLRHPLKREIIATHVLNSMINRVGSTFVHRLSETTGARPHEVVRAYLLAREIFGLVPLWMAIEALDNKVDDAVQSEMLVDTSGQLERGTTWFLRSRRLGDDMADTIAYFKPGFEALSARLPKLLDDAEKTRLDEQVGELVGKGVPRELAERVINFDTLYAALDIAEVAAGASKPAEAVAAIYFEVANRLGLAWLREKIAALPGDAHWQRLAKSAMQDDVSNLSRMITADVVAGTGDVTATGNLIAAWENRNRRALERGKQLFAELATVPAPDAAMLSVALRELRSLA